MTAVGRAPAPLVAFALVYGLALARRRWSSDRLVLIGIGVQAGLTR